MRHLELHIIQSVPVACLNRDDLNSPKTAIFGGVQRARVSSQSWKRAIREMAKEIAKSENSNLFNGDRTRRMVYALKELLVKDMDENVAVEIAEQVADIVETLDSKTDGDGFKKIKTVMFFSKAEYEAIADAIIQSDDVKNSVNLLKSALDEKNDKEKAKEFKAKALKAMGKILEKGAIAKAIKSAQLKDGADIALFGRMVANDPSLKVDGATMFAHILSTHKVDNEIDFFTAVDDLNKDETGAGMTSTLEFNSATYYRFCALNLDMLAKDDHLGDITLKDGKVERSVKTRQQVVKTFIESTIQAIPGARKTTMNGNTLPAYVLGIVREKGHPIQLVNAFEEAIRSNQGYALESVKRMLNEYSDIKTTWGITAIYEKAVVNNNLKEGLTAAKENIGTCSLTDLIDGMVAHVI
jgi:CRISPR system Cascade subunit CasC